jgi:hypothetical protein
VCAACAAQYTLQMLDQDVLDGELRQEREASGHNARAIAV